MRMLDSFLALAVYQEMIPSLLGLWEKPRFCKAPAFWVRLILILAPYIHSVSTPLPPIGVHLVSVAENVQHTEIELNIVGPGEESEHFSRIVKSGRLSPACGNHFERCKKLMAIERTLDSSPADPIVQLVLFVLAEGELSLADVRATTGGVKVQGITDVIPSDTSNPAAIYETRYQRQLASIEITGNTKAIVHFYDIIFNITSISQTKLSKIHSLPVSFFNLSELSNFEYVSLHSDDDSQYVCFAVSNLLISFNPFSVTEASVQLPNCIGGYRLTYARDSLLMATCQSGSVVYVDLDVMTVVNHTLPSEHPYACPDFNVDLKAYPMAAKPFIRRHFWDTGQQQDVDLHGHQYVTGYCFGTESQTFFTYTDKEQGMYCIDLSDTSKLKTIQLSSVPCPSSGCYPWAVFEDRYQLVAEGEGIEFLASVIDYQRNVSVIIKARRMSTNMITIAHLPTSSKSNPPTGAVTVTSQDNGFNLLWLIPIVALPLLITAATAVIVCKRRPWIPREPYSRLDESDDSLELLPSNDQPPCEPLDDTGSQVPPGAPTPPPGDPTDQTTSSSHDHLSLSDSTGHHGYQEQLFSSSEGVRSGIYTGEPVVPTTPVTHNPIGASAGRNNYNYSSSDVTAHRSSPPGTPHPNTPEIKQETPQLLAAVSSGSQAQNIDTSLPGTQPGPASFCPVPEVAGQSTSACMLQGNRQKDVPNIATGEAPLCRTSYDCSQKGLADYCKAKV